MCHCYRNQQSGQRLFKMPPHRMEKCCRLFHGQVDVIADCLGVKKHNFHERCTSFSSIIVKRGKAGNAFYLLEHLRYYDDYVKNDHYTNDTIFTHFEKTFCEFGLMGSVLSTSRPAACISWQFRASARSFSTTMGPRPRFKKIQLFFIFRHSKK